ncbi:MAG: DUF4358 domain-containing protein [Oscillospiraceae bacterium]|nr:DUF4358 domain-containing protein [Oscillospiraceae bacterium]
MKKLMALVLALVMVLGVCAGCGEKDKDLIIEPEAVASELVDGLNWDSEMVAYDEGDLRYYFDVTEETVIAGYCASTSTTEMVVAAQCEDEAAAQALMDSMSQYLSDLKMEADRYQPEEVARIDKAYLTRNGRAVVLCVSGDDRAAERVEAELKA